MTWSSSPLWGSFFLQETYEDVPLGIFHVSEANWGESGVEITAYDNMARFEKTIQIDNGSKQIYDFLIAATNACGVPAWYGADRGRSAPEWH
jgi:hypothetical protein